MPWAKQRTWQDAPGLAWVPEEKTKLSCFCKLYSTVLPVMGQWGLTCSKGGIGLRQDDRTVTLGLIPTFILIDTTLDQIVFGRFRF